MGQIPNNAIAVEERESFTEHVIGIPLTELRAPEFNPFQVRDGKDMDRLVRNVAAYGVREPGIVRPLDRGYELISGNRRRRACELAGLTSMPVIIRQMDDDEAAIAIADSNLERRETLLPSERAWAYRVKLEALNHRGSKSANPGQLSVEILRAQTGDSKNQIFRYVRLTELVPALLDKLDARQIAFTPAVEISYLTRAEQALVEDILEKYAVKPSLSQAQQLKKASQNGGLTPQKAESILTAPTAPPASAHPVIKRFRSYFPENYTPEQMENIIIGLLSDWSVSNTGRISAANGAGYASSKIEAA